MAVVLTVAIAGGELAARSALLAAALPLFFHGTAHWHAVSVVEQDGHVEVVLSHSGDHGDHDPGAPAHPQDPPPSPSDADHVVHFASDDATGGTRSSPAALLPLAVATAPPSEPRAIETALGPQRERRSRAPDRLRSVVLLL